MIAHDAGIARFYRLIEQTLPPQRADRSSAGTLPTRAYRYCDAVTSASAFGWWVFAPMDMEVLWDGSDIYWYYDGAPDWIPLSPSAQFPHQAARFDAGAPEFLKGCSPPFLTALPEAGALQIWTGLMARTAPGWSLLVRAPANLPIPGGYAVYEGIVETDQWFGPLFANLRLTRSGSPIHFKAEFPLIQVQPLPRQAYSDQVLDGMSFAGDLAAMEEHDWSDFYANIVEPNDNPDGRIGEYAINARRRRKRECPFAAVRQTAEPART